MRHLFAGILYSISFVVLCANAAIYLIGEYTAGGFLKEWWWLWLLLIGTAISAAYLSSDYAMRRPKPRKKLTFGGNNNHWTRRL